MKKTLLSVALISAIAAGYSMIGSDKSDVNVADLTSANVEVLAQTIEIGPFCINLHDDTCPLAEYPKGKVVKIEQQ